MLQPFKMRLTPPPGKKLIRDWNGLRVRTRQVLRNGAAEMPIGSLATVETSGGTGLHLKFDKCHCCGAAVYMSRVTSSDVEVIDAVVKSTSPDGKEAKHADA